MPTFSVVLFGFLAASVSGWHYPSEGAGHDHDSAHGHHSAHHSAHAPDGADAHSGHHRGYRGSSYHSRAQQAENTHQHYHYYYGSVHHHVNTDPEHNHAVHAQHKHSHGGHTTPTPPRTTRQPFIRPTPTPDHGQAGERGCRCDRHGEHHHKDKVWTFMIGDNFGAWEYIDTQGYHKGFYIDLMEAVCREAGKECRSILDSYTNCWNTDGGMEIPGHGLLDRWYDGCIGLFPSPERLNSFNFSVSFSPNFRAALHYHQGAVPANTSNIAGLKIGFIEGWAVGKRCLSRQYQISGNQPGEYEAVMFNRHEDMVEALRTRKVDAVMTVDSFDSNTLSLLGMVPVEPWFSCTISGSAMMARYDSEAIDWWNDAFQKLQDNGGYKKLCEQANAIHGHRGRIVCLEEE